MYVESVDTSMALNSHRNSPCLDDPTLWVDRYGDAMFRFALSRVGRQEVAEDLVQETFLAAWRARESFDGRSSFSTWLGGILRRKIADHYRQQGRDRVVSDVEASDQQGPIFNNKGKWLDAITNWEDSPEQLAQDTEFWHVMADCMSNLPSHLAEAFQLREMRMASPEEVAPAMGITPKNLSVRLHRARLLLRRCLDQKWFRGA
jgi:RNA polymerase sigma-70 factor (ECF subfamily)